jgi:adenosylcobinamide-phosphate synthase
MSFRVALAALAIDAGVGYPDWLFARIGHPVTWLGALIGALDRALNHETESFALRRAKGALAVVLVAAAALAAGLAIDAATALVPYDWLWRALLASSLIAQKSLNDHVAAVASALTRGLAEGRREVAKIVGRDVSRLDDAGVARAAIESLAENFSDGVVAPTLYLAVFGLPGALLYKAVNTADSMIGRKSERYLAFGWAAARCDDLFNLIPARLAAALIALAARIVPGADARAALLTALRDARRHASPNAGWPEAAIAGALGLALGGPRAYHGETVAGATLGSGRRNATLEDIFRALTIYRLSAALLWLIVLSGAAAGVR